MYHRKHSKFIFWGIIGIFVLVSGGYTFSTWLAGEPSQLVISEFLAANNFGPTDEDGDYSDWIEIHNRGDRAINLSGWSLTDDPNEPDKWRFPALTLEGQSYLLVFASGKNHKIVALGSYLHTNFKLARTDQFLGLYNILDNRFADEIKLNSLGYFRNVSYGRYGDFFGYFTTPTPGQANPPNLIRPEDTPPVAQFEAAPEQSSQLAGGSQTLIDPMALDGPLRISEIMYNPLGGDDYEYIELTNVGEGTLDLSGINFQGIEFTFPYGFPPLAPGQAVVVARNEAAFSERYPNVMVSGSYDGQLANSGEEIVVRDMFGNVVTRVNYDDENGWPLSPDGLGDSLVLLSANDDPNNPKNWQASQYLYGSPGLNTVDKISLYGHQPLLKKLFKF